MDQLSEEFWSHFLRTNPTYATLRGIHDHDAEIEDLSDDGLNARAHELRELRDHVTRARASSQDETITQSLLTTVIDSDLTELETEILVGPPDPYLGVHSTTLRAVAQTVAVEPPHASALAQRYALLPTLFIQAASRHRRLTDEGRSPAAVSVQRSIDQIDGYLASPLDTDPFVHMTLPEGWQGADRWRADMESTVTDLIRPAYAEYRDVLAEEILPRSRGDDEPGICHLRGGGDIYARLVERFVTVPTDPSEIHAIGTTYATETLVAEYAEIGQSALGTDVPSDIYARLRTDRSLRYESREEMLDHAREVVARAWGAIDGWLGARPDGPCRVLPVPDELSKDMPPAYYYPPAMDGSRPGTYFLNTHEPHTRDRFAAEAMAFHEAIPGHHFDRALATHLTSIPMFRRMRAHNVHAEGWGLYSERLADEMGLYSRPIDRLGMLAADSWRAGRLVVDTGMHQQGWTRHQAVQFMRDHTPVNLPAIDREVDRYIGWPAQALAYKMGHIEILRLRRRAEQELGSAFDLVGFHDTVLTSGSVSLPVLGQLVDAWIDQKRSG